jgi:hypothetical protein
METTTTNGDKAMRTFETNNSVTSIGIAKHNNEYTALTLTRSKTFKTLKGAERWLAKCGYKANGSRI